MNEMMGKEGRGEEEGWKRRKIDHGIWKGRKGVRGKEGRRITEDRRV